MSRTTVVRRDRVVTVTVIEQKPIVAVRPAKQVITVTSTRGPRGLDGADGVTSHPLLTDRDTVDSHPISAVTNLVSTLDAKVDVSGDTMTGSLTIGVGAADVPFTINQAETPTANIAEFNFFGGTGGDMVVVDAAGNMGIGAASPPSFAKLTVNGGDIFLTDLDNDPRFIIGDSGVGGEFGVMEWISSTNRLRFYNGAAANALVIAPGNNIGINEQSPNAKLHITNALASDVGFNIELAATPTANAAEINTVGTTGGTLWVVDAAGNMGIQQQNPTSAIHLNAGFGISSGIAFGDGDTGIFERVDDTITIYMNGGERFEFNGNKFRSHGGAGPEITNSTTSLTTATYTRRGDSDTGIGFSGSNSMSLITNGVASLIVDASQNILTGTTTSPTGTTGKVHVFGDNAGDPTMGSNTAATFAKDVAGTVHMFAIGETGAAQQLSSHDPDTEEWIHYSYNKRTGKKLRINLERFFHDKYPEYITEYQKGSGVK